VKTIEISDNYCKINRQNVDHQI